MSMWKGAVQAQAGASELLQFPPPRLLQERIEELAVAVINTDYC